MAQGMDVDRPDPAAKEADSQEIAAIVDEKIDRKSRNRFRAESNRGSLAPRRPQFHWIDRHPPSSMPGAARRILAMPHRDAGRQEVGTQTGSRPDHCTKAAGQAAAERVGLTVVTTDNSTSAAGYLASLGRTKAARPLASSYRRAETIRSRQGRQGIPGRIATRWKLAVLRRRRRRRRNRLRAEEEEIASFDALQEVVAQARLATSRSICPMEPRFQWTITRSLSRITDKIVTRGARSWNGFWEMGRFLRRCLTPIPPPPDEKAIREFVMAQLP